MKVNGVQLGAPTLNRETHERLELVVDICRGARRTQNLRTAIESIRRAQRELGEALKSARQLTMDSIFGDEA